MRLTRTVLCVLAMSSLTACATSGDQIAGDTDASEPAEEAEATDEGGGDGTVTVGSANFTENVILGEAYAAVLEEAGVEVERQLNLGSREIIIPALEAGEIDVLPEYIGSTYFFLLEEADPVTDTEELRTALEGELPDGLTLLESSEAQDQDAVVVTRETAEEYDLETVSDLAPIAGELVSGGAAEQETRPIGNPGLERVYGITFSEYIVTDAIGPITIEALNTGRIDVARLFTTDARIEENDFVVLEWDEPLVPAENVTPIVREDALTPEVEEALNEFSATLTTEDLLELNAAVDIEQQDPATVATEYLVEQGLIES